MLIRSRFRPSGRLLTAIVLASTGSVTGYLGCGGASLGGGDRAPCSNNNDCNDGFLCQNGFCSKACNVDRDCPSGDQQCHNGACEPVANAICTAAADCSAPATCETAAAAECVAGTCIYSPQVCDSPSPDECLANDTLYRAYPDTGVCNTTTGACEYTPVDIPCLGCNAGCLTRCQGVVCDDPAGGCKSQGLCVPEDPPLCSYFTAPDRTACELPSSPGTLGGICLTGDCAGCISNADCIDPPGDYTLCFLAACSTGACDYTPQPNVACEIALCSNGVVTNARLCGVDGTCPSTGTTSCGGLRCDPGGATCLTSCVNDVDCLSGFFCDGSGSGACIGTGADGFPCANPSQCQSGYCANGFCCQGGLCCDQDLDCPASFSSPSTCDDPTSATNCQGTRLDPRCFANVCTNEAVPDDSGCDDYEHTCPNDFALVICTADLDQAPPLCASTCVIDADCAAGYICQAPSCILQAGTGDACSGPGTCNTGLKCENSVCCDLAAGTCCNTDAVCTGGLACDTVAATCYETCNNLDSSRCADLGDVCLNNTCAAKVGLGTSCNDPAECQSNNCVDGVCCDDPCADVCQVCGADGLCDDAPADDVGCAVDCDPFDSECRNYNDLTANRCDSFGLCKVATLANCTNFTNIPAGTACGNASTTNCDAADTCDGGGSCVDRVDPLGSVCRADVGDCDRPEVCDGSTKSCPSDLLELPGAPCGSASNSGCDEPDTCDSSGTCVDNIDAAGTICRADTGECDLAEVCDGITITCPSDVVESSGTACGSSSTSGCNAADTCNNNGSCIDRVKSSGTVCNADAGVCDVAEVCDGSSTSCPTNVYEPEYTPCGDASASNCNAPDSCNAAGTCVDRKDPSGTICRADVGECDVAEVCNGTSNSCPTNAYEPSGTACGSSSSSGCDAPDTCDANGTCIDRKDPAGISCATCRTCNSSGSCIVNVADGTICGVPFGCSECQSGLCSDQCSGSQICCEPGICVCPTCMCP